jgi:hypothetical protein
VPAPYSDVLFNKNAFMVKQTTDDSSTDSDFNERSAKTVDPSHELVPLYLSGHSEPDPSEFTNQLRKRGRSVSSRLLVSVLAVSAIAIVFALFSSDNMRKIVADAKVLIGFTRPASSEPSQPDSVKLTAEQIELLRNPTRLSKPEAATAPREELPPTPQITTQSQVPTGTVPTGTVPAGTVPAGAVPASAAPVTPVRRELSGSEKEALFKQFLAWEAERKARAQISAKKAKRRARTAVTLPSSAGSHSTR